MPRLPSFVLLALALLPGCAQEPKCPAGRTAAENGTCVDAKVIDFVTCIDRAGGGERASGSATKLSADVRAASTGVATQAEFQNAVVTKVYPASDAQAQRIIESCNAYVFGGANAGGSTPPPGPGPGPAPSPPGPPAPGGSEAISIPTDGAWTLREREQWAALARQAQGPLDALNKSCGSHVHGAFAFETFRGKFAPSNPAGLDNEGVDHAVAPFSAVQQICDQGELERAAVRAKLARIEVRWGGAGRSTWSVEGTVLIGVINPAGESSFDYRADMRGPNGVKRRL